MNAFGLADMGGRLFTFDEVNDVFRELSLSDGSIINTFATLNRTGNVGERMT